MRIILKSASPRRKELLEQAGYDFIIDAAEIDETMDRTKTPYENVKTLGLKKAMVQQEKYPEDIMIGCDTIVVLGDEIFGKPKDATDAYEMLTKLSGKKHQVMSGVGIVFKTCVYNFVVTSDVYMKDLSKEDIEAYIETKECFGKAGSYAIQGIGRGLIDHYEGSLENIIGLPIDEVSEILGELYEMAY